jgi:putative flavoprotein involved in K+ transport
LGEHGVEHVVLEKHGVGHSWQSERWDSFCLVTPNWQCQLPGHAYAGSDPHGFMKKDEIVRYVQDYATRYSAPVREGVAVNALAETSEGFRLDTSSGELFAAQVVVATGAYHTPLIPESAATLPASIVSLHSSNYRNPDALPPGEVLVVGSGQSGCQIALCAALPRSRRRRVARCHGLLRRTDRAASESRASARQDQSLRHGA